MRRTDRRLGLGLAAAAVVLCAGSPSPAGDPARGVPVAYEDGASGEHRRASFAAHLLTSS